jgi:hypothetical protein
MILDQPIVASFPHFCNTSGPWNDYLDGLTKTCNDTIHQSYTIIEPTFGTPLRQRAISQCNVMLKDLRSFKPDFARFSNMIIPMVWMEYVSYESKNIINKYLFFVSSPTHKHTP